MISSYKDVLDAFFKEEGWGKRFLEGLSRVLKFNVYVFELDAGELGKVMRGREDLKKLILKALNGENLYFEEDIEGVKKLVRAEVLFYDPINSQVRFQTRIDERAAKEILKVR